MITWLVSSDTLPSEPPPRPDDGIDLLAAGCILEGASPPPNSETNQLKMLETDVFHSGSQTGLRN
jgi:hypothetical protein